MPTVEGLASAPVSYWMSMYIDHRQIPSRFFTKIAISHGVYNGAYPFALAGGEDNV